MPGIYPRKVGRRRLPILAVTLLVLGLVLYAAYHHRAGPAERREEGPVLDRRPVTLASGIHLLGGLAPAAAYVVETSDGIVLVDSGMESDAVSLKAQMKHLKLDWRQVRAVLLTHAHGDHSGGAAHLRAATGAKIYAGKGDAAVLRAGKPREAFFSAFPIPESIQPVPTVVDVELSGGEAFAIGQARFQTLPAPGHTPGSICYAMERDGQHVLFTGDIIQSFTEGKPANSQFARFGTYAAFLAPRYRGDARAFLATLRSLRNLPAPDLVLPGHPRNDAVPQSPAMTPARWTALLDAGIDDLERLVAHYDRDGASFLDDVPKQLLPNLYYFGDYQDVAVYGFLTKSRFVLVNAPGGTGLSKFLTTRAGQLGLSPASPSAVLLTSGNAAESAGLEDLLASGECSVVASPATRDSVARLGPAHVTFIEPDALARETGIDVQPVPPDGHELGSIGYLVHWENKSVLLSGRFPVKPSLTAQARLAADLKERPASMREFFAALDYLRKLRPDLWLPARPADGQNANLYGDNWSDILAGNKNLFK